MAGDRRLSRPDSRMPDWYIPDASYRPIPIAWFAAALVLQTAAISAVFFLLYSKNGWFTIALSALISGAILQWSWQRGLRDAAQGWSIALVILFALQLGFICVGVSDRL